MNDLFRQLEIATNTGCWSYDLKTQTLKWSEQAYYIHKLSKDSKIDVEKALGFYHTDDQETIRKTFYSCLEDKKSYKKIIRIVDTSGVVKLVEATGTPQIENNAVVSVFGTIKDLTKEVSLLNSKNEARHELAHYKSSLNQFLIIAETDDKGLITAVNDKFCEISKYSREELIGKDHRIVNSSHHPKIFFKRMWEQISNGRPWEGQICNQAKDGSFYWVETFIFPNRDSQNNISGFTSIRFDITEKKNLELELGQEKEKATFASQLAAVGEMSAGIAHEIANPLSIISTSNSLIKKFSSKEEIISFSNKIENATNRISKIINGLKNLAQKSRDDSHENYELSEILKTTLDFCEEVFRAKGIDLNVNIPGKSIKVFGNDVKLSQIFLNILNNAKDAILDSNVEEKWINVKIESMEDVVVIYIIDSGPGVPDSIKSKILDSFFTTKPIGKGTGLGLSLVKNFLDEHEGKISLCEDFSNTCFKIELPIVNS